MKETTQTQPNNIKNLTRRQIRYICFRLQTEAEGGNAADREHAGVMSFVAKVKNHMESQDDFGGWKMFAKTWDVDERSPLVVIKRNSSIYTDWNKILKKEARDFPTSPQATKIIEMPSAPSRPKKPKSLAEAPIIPPAPPKKSFWDALK